MTKIVDGPSLITAICDQLNRTDVAEQAETWVQMAEHQFRRVLRAREMIVRADASVTDGFVALPADLLELKSVQVTSPDGAKRPLTLASNDEMFELDRQKQFIKSPISYSVIDGSIRIAPAPTDEITLEIVYYRDLDALNCKLPGSTNFVLQRAVDAYLYSALIFSAMWEGDDERIQIYSQMASGAVQGLNDLADRAEHAGSKLNRRLRTF